MDDGYPPLRFSVLPSQKSSLLTVTSPTAKVSGSSNNNNGNSSEGKRRNCNYNTDTDSANRTNYNNNMNGKPANNEQHTTTPSTISNPKDAETSSKTGVSFAPKSAASTDEAASDYNQWLHAMKLVARLQGGMPPEFRRKLWLTLADKYLKSRNVDWTMQEKKCFSEEWREDDDELGVQIEKDLHRTGSNICSGPAASINQAKLKRILLGYARYNPEVGYCQGFNMLGALILQVMDKEEIESMKVMIYLVEGILPPGYFCGSMGGLQADMGVFRELMQSKLPRLAKHIEKLQGHVENALEPPLTNVFTMQWFLTMFCTCLPMSCVLRVWDLVLIEGSDVLLRTALVLWSLLEERVLSTRTADDFYCKMGSFASELLNGHLIDSNSLIEKVVQLGPIADIKKLRNKHLYNVTPLRHKSSIPLYFSDDEPENDEESRLAVATVWGMPWTRRGSQGATGKESKQPQNIENKDRLALDISLLKKQYDRLRERQKQAHIILTTACTTARQGTTGNANPTVPVNQLLMGRSAIITNQGRRLGPPAGAIPPARKPSLPAILQTKPQEKQLRRGETLHWRDTDLSKRRRDSLTWKEIKADRVVDDSKTKLQTPKLHGRIGKSDSSSYSEESEDEGSSTDTSLCDDDPVSTGDKTQSSSIENSPRRRIKSAHKQKESKLLSVTRTSSDANKERSRPKSWAPSSTEIPFMLMTSESPIHSADDKSEYKPNNERSKDEEDSATECDRPIFKLVNEPDWATSTYGYSLIAGDLATTTLGPLNIQTDILELPIITSTSQLSPMPDITSYLKETTISPLPTPKPLLLDSTNSLGSGDDDGEKKFDVNDDGVTNQYFERVNSVERPNKLDLLYSFNDEDSIRAAYEDENRTPEEPTEVVETTEELLVNEPPKICTTDVETELKSIMKRSSPDEFDSHFNRGERDNNIPGENRDDFEEALHVDEIPSKSMPPAHVTRASQKRRDPRRLTLTRSSTIEIEDRFQALENRLSNEMLMIVKKDEQDAQVSSENSDTESRRTLPSTADLEERFVNLERQRSGEAKSTAAIDDIVSISNKSTIPSTSDLEKRFEKQISASSSQDKDPIKLSRETQDSDKNNDKEARNEKAQQPAKTGQGSNTAETLNQTDLKDESDTSKSTASKPNLKKLPSTAELEDRFNALERKMSIEKSSSTKNKKEPPDIAPDKEDSIKTASNTEDNEKSKNISKNESKNKAPPNRSESQAKKSSNVDEKPTESAPCEDKPKKKVPPSTEELEKRFQALEKQMSTTSLTTEERTRDKQSDHRKNRDVHDSKRHENLSEQKTSTETNTEKSGSTTIKSEKDNKKPSPNEVQIQDEAPAETTTDDTIAPQQFNVTSKRRASEPPSTEDLEKRYESLKRRMSTRTIPETTQSERHEDTSEDTIKNTIDEGNEREDSSESKPSTKTQTKANSSQLSTKQLEENQAQKSEKPTKISDSNDHRKAVDATSECPEKSPEETKINVSPKDSEIKNSSNDEQIPIAPPMPDDRYEKSIPKVAVTKERRAVIEELQSKMQEHTNEDTFKPSSINPNRKPPATLHSPRETSETHKLHVLHQSDYYEPWHVHAPKMVRRFSDLPSRADLENRLEFLEQKFYRKLYKQRCASDSEVASRWRFTELRTEMPSTTATNMDTNLEKRLQALEKQLSENSLKLLEAMRSRTQETVLDYESPRKLSTETIDATGAELVRYTHAGELADPATHKPINISINIKMLVDKNVEAKQKSEKLTTAADLERRLEVLEQQLKESQEARKRLNNDEQPPQADDTKREEAAKEIPSLQKTEDHLGSDEKNEHNISGESTKDILSPQKMEENQTSDLQKENATKNVDLKSKAVNSDQPEQEKSGTESEKQSSKSKKEEIEEKRQESNEKAITSKIQKDETNELSIPNEVSNKEKLSSNINGNKQSNDSRKVEELVDSKHGKVTSASSTLSTACKDPKSVESSSKSTETNEKTKNNGSKENEKVQPEVCSEQANHTNPDSLTLSQPELPSKMTINTSELGPVDPNKKTLVLLLDNEPKAVKVRRLTRANTEELEGLFEALEKQLSERNLVKSEDGRLKHAGDSEEANVSSVESKAISDLTKEIEEFTSAEKAEKQQKTKTPADEEPYDWGPDPIKRHLKRKTAHLPTTKELEARFRSLERQIKLLEDVEAIDVEQRLNEIERKIKLQYSLAHEKDLTKFLELCEGKGLDDEPMSTPSTKDDETRCECGRKTPTRSRPKSPSNRKEKTPETSPGRKSSRSPARTARSPYTSPTRHKQQQEQDTNISTTQDIEYRYHSLDLKRSKSKESLANKGKSSDLKKQPIHPLEMLLDPSPDDSNIPTTGELEHRIRVLDEQRRTPTPPRRNRSRSPTTDEFKKSKTIEAQHPRTPIRTYERIVITPTKPEPPTEEELEARMRALEEEHKFDYKTQKNFKEFNDKLKTVISPSLSFEDYKLPKSRDASPRRSGDPYPSPSPRSTLRDIDAEPVVLRTTSPRVIRFRDQDDYGSRPRSYIEQHQPIIESPLRMVGTSYDVLQTIEENSKILHRILKKTITDSSDSRLSSGTAVAALTAEGLDAMGSRLMRETSPLRRTGTHTGVPLRTDDNINERLSSIKDTIKSIDTLCEEKPYRKEKCQRYIDSLFSDSVHFGQKKASLEDIRSRSTSRTRYTEYTPSIRISDLSQRPSEYYLNRSIGSAESIRTTSPLRAASPLHHRSNRDLSRNADISPGRRGRRSDEDREEYQSRVRRDYMLPKFFLDNHSDLRSSDISLTKFYKVDRQLEPYEHERSGSRSPSRSPLRSPYGSRETITQHNNNYTTTSSHNTRYDLDKPVSPYRQTTHTMLGYDSLKRSNTPVYNPSKLEIRHTTVTSTFYDRLLTEKQIEKSLTRPPSRSPIVSPSLGTKTYLDSLKTNYTAITTTSSSIDNSKTFSMLSTSPTTRSGIGTTITGLNNQFRPPATTELYSIYSTTISSQSALHPNTNTTSYSLKTTFDEFGMAITSTGNSSSHRYSPNLLMTSPLSNAASHNDLRIRSCDNILMQLHSNSTTTATLARPIPASTIIPTTTTTITTTSSMVTRNANTSLSYTSTCSTSTTTTTTATIFNTSTSTTYTIPDPTRINAAGNYLNFYTPITTAATTISTTNFSSIVPNTASHIAPMIASTVPPIINATTVAASSSSISLTYSPFSSYTNTATTQVQYPTMPLGLYTGSLNNTTATSIAGSLSKP